MQDSNRIIKKVAQAINLELDTEEVDLSNIPLEECETYDLDTKLTISLKKGSDGKEHYAVVYPTLLLYKGASNYSKSLETLTEKKAIATQHIQEVVQKYTATELHTDPDAVREEALKDLQGIFGDDFIVEVIFGTTTIQ
jgi:flagellar FliL protein